MIVRSSKFLLLFLAATLLGAALFAVVAIWQLSRGPVSLGFLTPYVEDSLNGGPNGVQVRLHDTVLTWAGLERTLDIRAVGLEILDSEGEVVAAVPEMSVQFSLRAMMRGLIAPTGLELFGPRLRVVRTPEGEVVVGMGAFSATGQSGGQAAGGGVELIGRLMQEPNLNTSAGYLRRVSIISGLIEFEDRQTGRNWTAQRAEIALERDQKGIRADGTIVLNTGGDSARFEVSGLLNRDTQSVELGISFDKLSPVVVASLDPRLGTLSRLNLPVSGTLAFSLAASLAVEDVSFDVTGGAGQIVMPEFYQAPLAVTQLALRGRATEALNSVVIDEASIDVGGPVATLSGEAVRRGDSIEFQLDSHIEAVPLDELATLWPPKVAVNARAWITKNIEDGVVNSVTVSMSAAANFDDIETIDLHKAVGEIDLHGATIHYLRPMTPVRDVTGLGRFDGVNLVFDIREGSVGELNVEAGRVAITGLTDPAPVETIRIEATIAGPTREALALLDEDPLNFISSFGIDPAQTGGTQTTNAVLEFPLLNALTVDEVDVAASARLENFSSPAVAFGSDITQGNFVLTANKKKLVAKGEGALASIPLKLTWTENFTDETALRTRYEVQTVLDDTARKTLGLEAEPILLGPVGVGLTFEIATDGAEQGAASLNLTDATMSLADFGWQKPAGQQGAATVEFTGRDGVLREISKFAITASELSVEGRAKLASDSDGLAVSELDLGRLVLGESDLSLRISFGDDEVPDIEIGGDNLDLRLPMKDAFAESGDKPPAMRVRIDPDNPVRAIRLGDETVLLNPTGRLAHDGENWTKIDLLGKLSNAGQINLQLRTVNGQREVSIESDDGGGVLSALDWVSTIEGGTMRLVGAFTNSGADETFAGQLSMEDFKLNEGSVTARILSLASFSGITDALAGTGITFRRAEVPFEVTDDEIKIGDAKARGADIGILASGRIDRTSDQIDLEGEIAPAYTLNSIFSNIPVIGPLLTGGGDAIFAATYTVDGPLDDPSVSVNPLSVLTPGILRRLVTGFGNGGGFEEGSTEQPAPTPTAE